MIEVRQARRTHTQTRSSGSNIGQNSQRSHGNHVSNHSKYDGITARNVLESHSLFNGMKEILIMHNGFEYRLKITRANKLILNK